MINGANGTITKAIDNPEPPVNGSVIKEPLRGEYGFAEYIFFMGSVADDIPKWGTSPRERDRQLRAFWNTEPVFAGALFSTVARYAAFGWQLTGPPRMIAAYERMLHNFERGKGWNAWLTKFLIDVFTQDNGAFAEIVREYDSPTAPVVTLNHLDSNMCIRTGRWDEPVIYYDRWGVPHWLKWYQVLEFTEMPSPIEMMRGMQYCALTRMLRAAQILRDISIYQREKVSGRFNRELHFVSGVTKKAIDDALKSHGADADAQGLQRYLQPAVIASLDPTANVKTASIAMASLPDGFSMEDTMRWYINELALAFGNDYQEYAPLPGGNLGSSRQSETLHLKSRGKGPRLFMSGLEHRFNFHGILPSNITFKFGDQDLSEDLDHTKLRIMRAEERAARVKSGEITPQVARQLAVDYGDLDVRYLAEIPDDYIGVSVPAVQGMSGPGNVGTSASGTTDTTPNNNAPSNNPNPNGDRGSSTVTGQHDSPDSSLEE